MSSIEVRRFAGHARYADQLDTPIRIAHLTDQHVGRVTPHRVQMEAVDRANAEEPDLVVLTGDFVAHSLNYLDELEEIIEAFQAPVLAVLGNHDHWTGPEQVRRSLRRAGAEVLDNAWTTITIGHQPIQIVGLDDAYTGNADRARAMKGLDPNRHATLALSHIAEEADGLWRKGVPMVLAGHTHGGQVTLWNLHHWAIGTVCGHKYVHGLYGDRTEEGAVYVSAGIGAAVVPLRVGHRGRREVSIFEIGVRPGDFTDDHHDEQPPLPGRRPSKRTRERRALAARRKAARRSAGVADGD